MFRHWGISLFQHMAVWGFSTTFCPLETYVKPFLYNLEILLSHVILNQEFDLTK